MANSDAVEWKPVARPRTHEYVLAQIEEQVVEGRLRPGDRLPGERQLAEALGVSRGAVREALRVLESMGVITAGTGSGPTAGSIISGQDTSALGNLLRLHLALTSFSQRELVEVRVQLEEWAAHQAAKNGRPSDFEHLRQTVIQMREPRLTYSTFNELDADFHVTIATISGNSLLALLMRALRDAVHREMVTVFETLSDAGTVVQALCSEHEEILDALEHRDGARAARLVGLHINRFYHDVAGGDSRG
jgi:GntR family transcriptional regulator, transcriptional repressor for pyruvate dehydrogenase complex